MFFTTKVKEIKLILGSIIAKMCQNDKFIQEAALNFKIYDIIAYFDDKSLDSDIKNKCIFLLTGMLYGDSPLPKRVFLTEFNGLNLLIDLLKEDPSRIRVYQIINEITKLEEKVDKENFEFRAEISSIILKSELPLFLLNLFKELDINNNDFTDQRNCLAQIFVNLNDVYKEMNMLDEIKELFKSFLNQMKSTETTNPCKEDEIANIKEAYLNLLKESSKKKTEINLGDNVETLENGAVLISISKPKDEENKSEVTINNQDNNAPLLLGP